MFSKEFLAASAMVCQHHAFAQLLANSDADNSRQETPLRTTMYVQDIIAMGCFAQPAEQTETPQNGIFGGEYLSRVAILLQLPLQYLHLPRDSSDTRLVITY